jgi:sugar (pentulose or hexulose) kinase
MERRMRTGYLGIDAGTQGLSIVYIDHDGKLVATGNGHYSMVSGLSAGCYEQLPQDWETALAAAMRDLRNALAAQQIEMDVNAIGISGQMHGEVLLDDTGRVLAPARLWCDSRNDEEGLELTRSFGLKVPKRMTAARWLWSMRNRSDIAQRAAKMTTPGGWLAFRLTGEFNLGIGDASGMFPIDQATLDFDRALLQRFDEAYSIYGTHRLEDLLPNVRRAGEVGGQLNEVGARLLGLPQGIPIAPAEGDQPASLAGSLIGTAGMIAVSFGTSVCANSVGDREFHGVNRAIDHFCAPDGKPINMVFLRNGTTFMNSMVQAFAGSESDSMSRLMSEVLRAPADCDGVFAIPFMDDEPGLGINAGGHGSLFGLNNQSAKAGNIIKAALLSTMCNLKLGMEVLEKQGYPRKEIFLSGGLTKTPALGQVLADVMELPVTVQEAAAEGCAYGAALLAQFRHKAIQALDTNPTWEAFLADTTRSKARRFEPQTPAMKVHRNRFQGYCDLLARLFCSVPS